MTQRITTSAEQFAARGDVWNARNEQHHAVANPWRRRLHPDGTRELIEDHLDVEGYDEPTTDTPRRAIPKREWMQPVPVPSLAARLTHNRERREWLNEQALRRPIAKVFK